MKSHRSLPGRGAALLILLAALGGSAPPAQAAPPADAPSPLTNPGFEGGAALGVPNGWQGAGLSSDAVTCKGSALHSGLCGFLFKGEADGQTESLAQTFALAGGPGDWVRVGLWARAKKVPFDAPAAVTLELYDGGVPTESFTLVIPAGKYKYRFTGEFFAPTQDFDQARLTLSYPGASGRLTVDDVRVVIIPAPQPVSDARYAHLARGINVPGWFWWQPPNERLDTRFSDADLQLIADLGFTFVRLPIDLEYVMSEKSPDLLNHTNLPHLDLALDRLEAHGLAAMVDIHTTSIKDSERDHFAGRLENDPAFAYTYAEFWRSFAAHLSSRDPDLVFLEIMNEPAFEDREAEWWAMQAIILQGAREGAPEHTLIANPSWWSSWDDLVLRAPYADPNIIYDFHWYDPFVFTFQGRGGLSALHDIPYPSSPAIIAPYLNQYGGYAGEQLEAYGDETWNAAKINGLVGEIDAWADGYGVRVLCNELGVVRGYPTDADRAEWAGDLRAALEGHGIGWALWNFDWSDFGLVVRDANRVATVDDPAFAAALGLSVP